jgi:NAD(P)-dependent dehydrogenase (short-subunit alcohol dehydrogenase family)
MDLNLSDQTAIVSGSTAGIGFAIADALAQEGASVIVNGRTSKRVDAAIAKIHQTTPKAKLRGIVADLATMPRAAQLFSQVPEVDCL